MVSPGKQSTHGGFSTYLCKDLQEGTGIPDQIKYPPGLVLDEYMFESYLRESKGGMGFINFTATYCYYAYDLQISGPCFMVCQRNNIALRSCEVFL